MAAQSVGETSKKARPIYFVLAFLRLDVPPIDRSSFGSLKNSLGDFTRNKGKVKNLDARSLNLETF